jgi:hypothetical protein
MFDLTYGLHGMTTAGRILTVGRLLRYDSAKKTLAGSRHSNCLTIRT